jgi:hypothetical protein
LDNAEHAGVVQDGSIGSWHRVRKEFVLS